MANITIDRGESVSLGFEINGIVITDLLDLQVYVGEWVFKLSDSTITQDVSNTRLFFVKLNSTLTNRCVGTMPISLAIVTDLLGVNKQSNIASLIVKETNQRTVLDDLANYIAGTFVVTIDLDQINTNVILENIYQIVPSLIGVITIEIDSTLTNYLYAPEDIIIQSTTNINGSPTISLEVNNVAYTLGNLILQGDLITINSDIIGVVNLNITYE
tara:strand:- start:19129 stop:19773 length:645 start_codon:yes stop_codon:yes gene_type:complete